MQVHRHDEVVSTNDTLVGHALGGAPSGTVVVAHRQTGGRGRHGRSWLTLPGDHVFMSVLWRPPAGFPVGVVSAVTLAVGVAVADVLRTLSRPGGPPLDARVKWPNDIWIGGLKVAGILSELHDDPETHTPFVVIGLGVDVNAERAELPAELAPIATTLAAELGAPVDLDALVDRLVAAVRDACTAFGASGGLGAAGIAAYTAHCVTIGQRVRVDGRVGRATGIASDGALLVVWDARPDGHLAPMPAAPERVVAGDVELLGRP